MFLFFIGIAILILGYFTYGKFIEKILTSDECTMPSKTNFDGVDFLPLPHWKNLLIELLNIAGIGPVIGVILGIKFGAIVFLIIPIGNVIGGAVHDYILGMMSVRYNGANLPTIVRYNFGEKFYKIFSTFVAIILILVVTVFINIPASLINGMTSGNFFWIAVIGIFAYYCIATLFPIDTIIGKLYPIFGGILLIGTIAIFIAIMYFSLTKSSVDLLVPNAEFIKNQINQPIIPVLFVTIACGILSGFHGTQVPIVARTMNNQQEGKSLFYGMMILEGIIAMVWAAAGMAIYNLFPNLMQGEPMTALMKSTDFFLGTTAGKIVTIGVILLAITSGDTAMRSLRLTIAEAFKINQNKINKRLIIVFPIIIIVIVLLFWSNKDKNSFNVLWNYFAWGNQIMSAVSLLAGGVYLYSNRKNGIVALIPGFFITFIVFTYILFTPHLPKDPLGFGFKYHIASGIGAILTLIVAFFIIKLIKKNRNK